MIFGLKTKTYVTTYQVWVKGNVKNMIYGQANQSQTDLLMNSIGYNTE